MTVNGLPKWASFIIAGLAVLVIGLSGVCGTLLVNDRQTIAKALSDMNIMMAENKKINDKQNFILNRVCELLGDDYKTRLDKLNRHPWNYPWNRETER